MRETRVRNKKEITWNRWKRETLEKDRGISMTAHDPGLGNHAVSRKINKADVSLNVSYVEKEKKLLIILELNDKEALALLQ